MEYDQDNYTIRRITKKGTYVLNTLAGTQALNGRGISKDQLTIVEEEQSEEEQSEEESEEQSEEESKAVQTWDNYDGQSEEEQSEEELPMGTKVKYEQEDYTIKRRTNNGTYVLNTAAGKQALKGRGISKDQLTIVGKQSEDGQPVLVADTTDDEEEEEEEEAVEEEEESLAKMYEEVDLDDVDMLNLLGSDDDDVLNLLEEEEEEEKEDDIDTPEIEFRKAGFDTDQILNAAEDKTVSQGGLNDTGIERILKANKISSDGDDTDRLERLKMLVNGELFSMNDENTEASKFYYPDDYVPEQILNGSKGLTKSKDGLSKEDIKLILQLNGQPEDGKRKVLNKRLRAILPSEDELLAVSSSESDDDDDDVSDDDEDKRLGGGLAALEKMKQKRDDEDERNRARASIDRDRGRYSTRLQHTPGDLSMMLAEMSDDWATSEDELNFAEESDSEFKSSSGVDFAESSATSGPDFAESSSAETDDESLISSNALSFAESSASDGPVIPSSDAMEFAESSDAVSEKKTSDIDFAESSDYD